MIFKPSLINKSAAIVVMTLFVSACSNNAVNSSANSAEKQTQYVDSYEGFNRKVYAFNNTVDGYFLKPIAKVYRKVTPSPVDKTIGNFFSNLDDVGNAVNNTLQGKFAAAGSDVERVVFNSTLGFGGLVDVASSVGLKKHNEDFGQTLATWGVGSGPYLMIPFLGPSTVRDGSARLTVDRATKPTQYTDENIELFILETVKTRSDFISREGVLDDLSDDKYSAIRDLWIDNRKSLINDGRQDEGAASDMIDELESLDDI